MNGFASDELDILTDHQTRNIRDVDRDSYRIAIEMWNDNHRRFI